MAKMVEELSKRQSLKGQRWLLSRAAGSFFHCESSSALAFLGHIKTAVASFLARRWERASELERKAMTAALSAMVEECKVAFPSPALHTQAGVAISGFRSTGRRISQRLRGKEEEEAREEHGGGGEREARGT
eukprot:1332976-Rhodomonas_salina.1